MNDHNVANDVRAELELPPCHPRSMRSREHISGGPANLCSGSQGPACFCRRAASRRTICRLAPAAFTVDTAFSVSDTAWLKLHFAGDLAMPPQMARHCCALAIARRIIVPLSGTSLYLSMTWHIVIQSAHWMFPRTAMMQETALLRCSHILCHAATLR